MKQRHRRSGLLLSLSVHASIQITLKRARALVGALRKLRAHEVAGKD